MERITVACLHLVRNNTHIESGVGSIVMTAKRRFFAAMFLRRFGKLDQGDFTMLLKKKFTIAMAGLAMLGTAPAFATGIGHSFFMRGSIVGTDTTGTVVCVGKADGATVGQVLEVYRVKTHPGPNKSPTPTYHRELVGHVKIDHIFDEHFAHVSATDGTPAVHDIVELRRK